MNSRERVLAALAHQEPDRVPIDLGSSIVTSITRRAYDGLRRELALPSRPIEIVDQVQQLPRVHDDLLERLGWTSEACSPIRRATGSWRYRTRATTGRSTTSGARSSACPRVMNAKGAKGCKEGSYYFDWAE